MRFGFLGAGKMATAIARGMVEQGGFSGRDLVACDPSAEARRAFTAATGVTCVDLGAEWTGDLDVLFLAVKPQCAADAVSDLPPLPSGILVISIAAGIGIAALEGMFPGQRIIRVMPNTPLVVGKGASAYALGPGVAATDADLVQHIFGGLGIACHVHEALMDAVTALSGSGPAYVFEMVQALTEAGGAAGLPAELALRLTVQTVAGAAEMLSTGLGSPEELRDAVTSKGGTTAAGLAVLREGDFRSLMAAVVSAARVRSAELGRPADARSH